jgi:tRNA(fMet)-specific endonuclease VapC
MAIVLLDTTVASFLHPRKRGSTYRAAYEPHLRGNLLAMSFQTVAELFQWAEQSKWPAGQRAALDEFVAHFLVIPYDTELARTRARVMTLARDAGRRMESGDAWIAATATHRGIPVITHDKDFLNVTIPGLQVICHAD